ncbi:MAG TPA: HoxN/HupN/NixA family nickel/cobalt transporter [Burkholderiales bacterium]|nr:HoxN/HupN/NixA family nickel/cobalt transporter [Burkholderiales bacterium]
MSRLERALNGVPRRPLALLLATLLAANAVAWLAAIGLATARPGTLALAGLAWILGARHAFDVDHIAAIDNVTRKLRHEGERPVAVGFFFALGHSSIVVALCAAVALGARGLAPRFSELSAFGGVFGTAVSAAFLTFIGLVNLRVLRQLVCAWRAQGRAGAPDGAHEQEIGALLDQRGLFARAFRFLLARVSRSWHMYPIGALFGLGFDTATEIAILGISAGLATTAAFPLWGILVFALLFTAGMTLIDSLDGVVMLRAYHWAIRDARRRLSFNAVITGMAACLATVIGALEWVQLLAARLGSDGPLRTWLGGLDFGAIGFAVVLAMLATWGIAAAWERMRLAPARRAELND